MKAPCCGSNCHRRRRLHQGLLQQPGCPVVVQGAPLAEAQGGLPPRFHLLLSRGGRVLLLLLLVQAAM
jgi:hypothetical protein